MKLVSKGDNERGGGGEEKRFPRNLTILITQLGSFSKSIERDIKISYRKEKRSSYLLKNKAVTYRNMKPQLQHVCPFVALRRFVPVIKRIKLFL